MFILDRSKNDTSVTLDLLRAVAAQMVCVGHGISFFVPAWRTTELPIMQTVGVLIFFVLSGTLITFTLIERSKQPSYGFGTFFLEWFARIYSGLIPALLFVAVVDGIVIYGFRENAVASYYTAKTFVANLFMLEAYRGISFRTTSDGLHSARPVRSGHWQSNGTFTCSSAPSSSYGPGLSSACS